VRLQVLEWLSFKVNRLRSDNEILSLVSLLGVGTQERKDGNTTNSPVGGFLSYLSGGGGKTSESVLNEGTSGETIGRSKGAIEVGRMSTTALVAEEVADGTEGALVGASLLSLGELNGDEVSNELLSLNLGELDVSSDFSLNEELLLEEVREGGIKSV